MSKNALSLQDVFYTARCRLRAAGQEDIAHVWSATRYIGFNDGLAWEAPRHADELKLSLQRKLAAWRQGKAYNLTIENKQDQEFIGRISLTRKNRGVWSMQFWVHPEQQYQGYATECVRAAIGLAFERLSAEQVEAGYVEGNGAGQHVLQKLGFQAVRDNPCKFMRDGDCVRVFETVMTRQAWGLAKQHAGQAQIERLHQLLNVAGDYAAQAKIPRQMEADYLVSIGTDIYGRTQYMIPAAAAAWQAMRDAAAAAGVPLQVVSAFRSLDYQKQLLQRKLAKGDTLEAILKVNAAPGYSEHHTGCALDLTTPESEVLTESFEHTAAFNWLRQNAAAFSFYLSYPRESTTAIVYEPWHWAWRDPGEAGAGTGAPKPASI